MGKEFWGKIKVHIPYQLWKTILSSKESIGSIYFIPEDKKGYIIAGRMVYFIPIYWIEGTFLNKQRKIKVDLTELKFIPLSTDFHITIKRNMVDDVITDLLAIELRADDGVRKKFYEYTTNFEYIEKYKIEGILQETEINYQGKKYRYMAGGCDVSI